MGPSLFARKLRKAPTEPASLAVLEEILEGAGPDDDVLLAIVHLAHG